MPTTDTAPEADTAPEPRLRLDEKTVRSGRRFGVGIAAVALLAAGLVTWAPWQGGGSDLDAAAVRVVDAREDAERAAADGLVAFHTIDHTQIPQTIDAWLAVSAGALHGQVARNRAAITRRTERAGSDSTATPVRTGVAAFDADAGDATVIAVLAIRTVDKAAKETTSTARFRVRVQRIDAAWKLTYLEKVKAG